MPVFELIPGLNEWKEGVCVALLGLCAMIASAGGVGGGPINVSIMLFLGVPARVAIPLSKAAIFGGSLVLMLFNLFQRSPDDPDLPIIQWDFVYVIEPAAVVGAFVGAVINSLLPNWFLVIVEAIFLTYVGVNMVRQGIKTIRKERAERAAQAASAAQDGEAGEPDEAGKADEGIGGKQTAGAGGAKTLLAGGEEEGREELEFQRTSSSNLETSSELQHARDGNAPEAGSADAEPAESANPSSAVDTVPLITPGQEKASKTSKTNKAQKYTKSASPRVKGTPAKAAAHHAHHHSDNACHCGKNACSYCTYVDRPRMINFSLGIVMITVFTLMQNFFPKCSTPYWVSFAAGIAAGFLVMIINTVLMHKAIRKYTEMTAEQPELSPHEATKACRILMGSGHPEAFSSIKYYIKFSSVGLAAGVMSAALGIGGGLLKNPVLLAFGIDLFTARAASGTMITFTAFSSFITYLSLGQISFSYAWVLMLVMTVMFPTGYFVSNWVIRLVKSRSVISFAMAIIVILSDAFIIYQVITDIIEMVQTGEVEGFSPFC